MLMAHIEINQLRTEIQPLIAVSVPEPDSLALGHVHGIRAVLNRPRKHGVIAIILNNLF
jgi:hypothetical protein